MGRIKSDGHDRSMTSLFQSCHTKPVSLIVSTARRGVMCHGGNVIGYIYVRKQYSYENGSVISTIQTSLSRPCAADPTP